MKCVSASLKPSQVRVQLEGTARVGADNLVHAIAELKTTVFNRDKGVGQRAKSSVDETNIRHSYTPRLSDRP